jgi:hypothetical protein
MKAKPNSSNFKSKANEYFNGLQVKFSYAITCHKPKEGSGIPYSSNNLICLTELTEITSDGCIPRWAKNKLYLIGFKDESFVE